MYKVPAIKKTKLTINNTVQGETLEQKIERIVNNKEPIKDGAPLIYTERKEGVRASTNIRTDRFEIAIEGTDKIAKSYKARREERHKPKKDDTATDTKKDDGGAKPIQGKNE